MFSAKDGKRETINERKCWGCEHYIPENTVVFCDLAFTEQVVDAEPEKDINIEKRICPKANKEPVEV